MGTVGTALAALHRRYNGPIDECIREAVLTGQPRPSEWSLSLASRDIDRLALATVVARAGQRTGTAVAHGRHERTATALASPDMLLWYRGLGVRTTAARDRIRGHKTAPPA